MVYPRMIEEKMLKLLRRGEISKWFSGIGQEAISVGVTMALNSDDLIFPLHRNLGVFTSRMVPLERLISQWQGKPNGFTSGRDRSFHFGSLAHSIIGMISHLGSQLSLAVGAGLASVLSQDSRIAVAFSGEGATSEGDFHEAMNLAAVWKLPVIFVIENNGYALSTPTDEQYACKNLSDKGMGYGMRAYKIDGNNVLEVFATMQKVTKQLREKPEPILIECSTFRVRGHEEASGTKYVPKDLMDKWKVRDPIASYEHYLLGKSVIDQSYIDRTKLNLQKQIDEAVVLAFQESDVMSTEEEETAGLFESTIDVEENLSTEGRPLRYIDAIKEALDQSMAYDEKLVLMGQDIAEYGGAFKATEGLYERYGGARVRNTPLCESAVIGAGIGLSLRGYRAMIEMQFSDFITCGFNQVVNNLAKMHWRWGHAPKVVIRMPTGGNVGAGPFHSQNTEAWFVHTPGLKIVYPSNAYDAKGLLIAALQEANPVLFYEHKFLYRSNMANVPKEMYTLPIGKASVARSGTAATVITYGLGVIWAQELAMEEQIDLEIIDLRSLAPIDYVTCGESLKKTGKVVILHEASMTGGVGAEIAAHLGEHYFEYLDAPILRSASIDTPVPFAKPLEELFLPVNRFKEQVLELISY